MARSVAGRAALGTRRNGPPNGSRNGPRNGSRNGLRWAFAQSWTHARTLRYVACMISQRVRRAAIPFGAAAVIASFVLLAGCSGGGGNVALKGRVPSLPPYVGDVTLPEVHPGAPDVPFALRAEPGHLLYVYFGYTNCPDICPTTLADLRHALKQLGPDGSRVQVAFVTVDTYRDTAEVLVPYLESFTAGAHALYPRTQEQLGRAEASLGATSSASRKADGTYEVSHTGLGTIVDDQGRMRVQWDFGVAPKDIVHDLRILLAPADVAVANAWARTSPAGATAGALYMTLTSKRTDQLVGVSVSPSVAARAEMHVVNHDAAGQLSMHEVSALPLPAGAPMDFRPGAQHIMLLDLAKPLVAGDTIAVTLRLARGGELTTRAIVRDEP